MKKALEGFPGVCEVTFNPRSDAFAIEGSSALDEEEVRSAALGQVIFPRLRRLLGSLNGLAGARTKMP